jgi:hypothetical protein
MIEPLESRIAPAAVAFTAYNFNDKYVNSQGQTLLQFYNAADPSLTGANLAIAKTVGQNSNVYFIKVSSGQDLKIYNTQIGAENEVNVTTGTVVAFFTLPSNNPVVKDPNGLSGPQVLGTDLTGLALGNKVSVAVGGGVYGDVVTNYNDVTGTLGGLGESAGNATQLLTNTVTSLSVAGPITGGFITGGNVGALEATGTVGYVYSGSAGDGYTYHFESPTIATLANAPGNVTLSVQAPGNGIAGPSISDAVLGSVNVIQLGAGGPGGAGGSLNGLTLLDDGNDATITAGNGGSGVAGRVSGGIGGSISNVLVHGPLASTSLVPNAVIQLVSGNGGDGYAGGNGRGGAAGKISNVYMDYDYAGLAYASVTSLQDNVVVQGGTGGSGSYGGAGGSLTNINLLTSTPHVSGSLVPEIQVLGGPGGTGSLGSGGAGGSVSNTYINDSTNLANLLPIDPVTNLPYDTSVAGPSSTTSTTLTEAYIHGGDAGVGVTSGGAGGSITGATLEGFNFSLVGGNGAAGHVGGAGGGVSIVTVLGSNGNLPGDDFHIQSLNIQTGNGGDGTLLGGGKAGSLYALTVNNADFGIADYNGLQIALGHGGDATRGVGGAGGGISLVHVTGVDFLTDAHPQGNSGNANIVAGNGGNAPVAGGRGGAGGGISNVTIVNTRLNVQAITAGNGGNGGVNASTGTGGAGGAVSGVAVRVGEDMFLTSASVTTASPGLLYDSKANFTADGVLVGDEVINTTNQQTSTVTVVYQGGNELGLTSDIFAAGDNYTVVTPGNGQNPQAMDYTGTDMEINQAPYNTQAPYNSPQDTIIDTGTHFSGVQVGDVVYDVTDGLSATVTGITNINTGVLNVSNDISHVGDQFAFSTLGGVVATPTTILVQNVVQPGQPSGFLSEGIPTGTIIEDLTATAAATAAHGGIPGTPITATVTAVNAQSLTVSNASSASFGAVGDLYSFITLGQSHVTGGNGGYGILNGAGGAGGGVSDSSAVTDGTDYFAGGNGGSGGVNGTVGAGGSLASDGAFSTYDSGSLIAGHAGLSGARAGAGGSVSGAVVEVLKNVTLQGGFGTSGGAGGGISSSGYSGVLQNGGGFNPPAGNVTIQAGNGGASGTSAGGAGGTITEITGFVSSGDGNAADSYLTQFIAGNGGSGTTKAGAGGSVEYIRFFGGGGAGVTFFMNAGNAGDTSAAAGRTGAAGGSILHVGGGSYTSGSGNTNFSINPLTDFHHISAGNGGYGSVTGGVGGSVEDVYVNATIGVRSGDPFGFDIAGVNGATVTGMGGISAGTGGLGGKTSGLAGNVTYIAADAIASIVAGQMHVGQALEKANLANKVDGIILNGTSYVSPNHEFTISFDGMTTVPLATNATPIQVASALNALSNIAADGGVSVSESNGQYQVAFNVNGPEDPMTVTEASPYFTTQQVVGSATAAEVENVQVLPSTTNPFTLTFNGATTTQITLTGNTATDQTNVQNALNALNPSPNVTVIETPGTATTFPSFQVTFGAVGAQNGTIVPNFIGTVTDSGSTTPDTQTITLPDNTSIEPAQIATANFVGSIVNPVRPNAATFDYTPLVSGNSFVFGDAPIDGLIAALGLTSFKNFVPQAYVTADASGNAVLVNNVNG